MSFNQLFNKQQKVFIPFFILGFPTLEKSLEIIKAAIDAGCQAIELGIPFSDATADGKTIQQAYLAALENQATFNACLKLIEQIRRYSNCAISLLLYANLVFAENFSRLQQLKQAGADAVLVVDIPFAENEFYQQALVKNHLASCYLIAPNTSPARISAIMQEVQAYAYLVADYGTTNIRNTLAANLAQRISEIKNISEKPLVVGFGISNPSQANQIFAMGADGVIVGSALVKLIQDDHSKAAQNIYCLVKDFLALC